jgi:putative thioredoxin
MEVKSQIFDVEAATFEETVIKGSSDRVIVVDFWAPWCGPCKTLGPMLEEVITALGPGVALAKVNVDDNQELAMAFRVQGIPAVKVVMDGKLVDEFTGALPKDQIEALLRKHVPDAPASEAETVEELLSQGSAHLDAGDLTGAEVLYDQVLAQDSEAFGAVIGLARIRLLQGETDQVRELVSGIEQGNPEYDQGQALLTQLNFSVTCQNAGGHQVCAEKLLANPDDLGARFTFGCCAAVAGDYETALKEWFVVVSADKDFRQGAAKDALVSVFHLLGRNHPAVGDYPKQLYRVLY